MHPSYTLLLQHLHSVMEKPETGFSLHRLPVAIVRQTRQITGLDISPQKVYPPLSSHTSSHPISFQRNPNLPELAMKPSHSKGVKVEPPRDFGSFLEAFLFER